MAQLKNKGPKLYFSQVGGEQPIPPEFIAAMERAEEVQPVPDNVAPEALSDLIVESKVETNRTDERVRRTVKKKTGNITLSAVRTNDQGKPVQVTLTMFPTGTTPDVPSATKEVAVHDLGNGWSIQEAAVEGTYVEGTFTPGVFANALFARERPNLIPEEFRPSIATVTTRTDSAGTAVDPTLSGTELREQQEQVTEFKKRITIDTQALPALPVTLDKGRDTTNEKQDVTVTKKLIADATAADVATALKDVKVIQLGDGNKVQETREVSSVFAGNAFAKERPNLVPPEFRPSIPTVTTKSDSAGTAAAPSLSGDDLRKGEEQVNAFVKRVTTETQASPSLPVSLSGKETTELKQVATVVRTLETAGTAATSPTALVSVKVENLGNGMQVQETKTIPSTLTLPEYIAEKRRLLPELFFVGTADTTVETTAAGSAAAPTLTGNQLRVQDKQLDEFTHRTSTTTGGTVADATSFTGKEHISQFGGGIVDNVQTKAAANTLTTDFRTVEAESVPLGDGKFLVREKKLPSGSWPVLTETEWDEFAQKLLTTTKQFVAVGTVTPGLSAGVLTEEKQYDDLHTLKIVSQYAGGVPSTQTIPVVVEVSVPDWFTTAPTQKDAVSGYAKDRGADYATQSKHGKFPGTLTREFSNSIPSAPAGTYLNFEVISSQEAEDYAVSGTDQYAKILYYNIPNHIATEPTGDFIVGFQVQQHKHLWVAETLEVSF